MNKITSGLVAVAALCAAGMITTTAPADARATFSITLGNTAFGYNDGYYDQNRRWHRWRNSHERRWYQSNHSDSYFNLRHTRDNDTNRNDWRRGKNQDWHGGGNH